MDAQKTENPGSSNSKIRRPCVWGKLRRASRLISQVYNRFLQPSGLKITQFSLLMSVKCTSALTITQLSEEALMDRTTCTRNLRVLKRMGFIEFRPTDDERIRKVVVTAQGNDVLERAIPLWEDAQDFIFNQVGENETMRLLNGLSHLTSKVRKA